AACEETVPGELAWCARVRRRGHGRSLGAGGDEGALADVGRDQPARRERGVGGAHRVAGDAERTGRLAAGGRRRAWGEPAGLDEAGEVIGQLTVEGDAAAAIRAEGDLEHAGRLARANWPGKALEEPIGMVEGGPM